jgi:hypothetical protein
MAEMRAWYNDATMRHEMERDIRNADANRKKARVQLESEYLSCHANMVAMIENLREFAQSMPAPNDDNEIPSCINWAVLGDYKRIEAALVEVCKVADEIGK